jgi:alpha-L-fucosidase 2
MSDLELWYTAPAAEWTEALPVGNGRLGAMVFGGVGRERLQLNEDTLWSGGPYSQVNPEAGPNLKAVQALLLEARFQEAEALADRHLMGRPFKQMSFHPIGDVWIDHKLPGPVGSYRRSLDLASAVARTEFEAGGIRFTRHVFASAAEGILAIHLRATRPGSIDATFSLTSPQESVSVSVDGSRLRLEGRNRGAEGVEGALRFAVGLRVLPTGGDLTTTGESLRVTNADDVLVLVDAATSFRRFDLVDKDPRRAVDSRLAPAAQKSLSELRASHDAEHRRLFERMTINLGRTAATDLPTDQRIASSPVTADPALAALYVQFARYLMIACSRPGTQPANLQGLWNDRTDPPWGSKYTSNINLQMNYWLPDLANLSECFEPLIRLAEEVSETGAEIAKAHYGARGWVMHHNTDLWRAAGPVDGARWGLWPTGGVWLCVQLWDHAVFRGRPEALVRRLHPLLAGAARFVLDTLVPLPGTGELVTCPSVSPENEHPFGSSLCVGPAMDRQLIRDLFDALEAAARDLGIEDGLVAEARLARPRIAADRVGREGQLQEWLEDWDMQVPEPHHRHVSHLYGLYPSRQIHPDRTPDLARAARRSLEIRGDEATGWGIGWRINLWARLRDGDRAHDLVRRLLAPDRTYPNMFDAHPPFQIDGNFGGAAGILEMLVQSDEDTVFLLPALPSAWPTGTLKGVGCRGGLTVDLEWREARLVACSLVSGSSRPVTIRYDGKSVSVELTADVATMFLPPDRLNEPGGSSG